jgi:hypothetical protein
LWIAAWRTLPPAHSKAIYYCLLYTQDIFFHEMNNFEFNHVLAQWLVLPAGTV